MDDERRAADCDYAKRFGYVDASSGFESFKQTRRRASLLPVRLRAAKSITDCINVWI